VGKQVSFRRSDVAGPPDGEAWVWHTATLLRSAAWRGKSVPLGNLIEFLEIEHLQHGGAENGSLVALYADLVRFGIGRRHIAPAIKEGERRGLIAITQAGRSMEDGKHLPSRYRLTYLPTRKIAGKAIEWAAPTNEWRRFKAESSHLEKQKPGAPKCTRASALK
jgi:hypothetical protein